MSGSEFFAVRDARRKQYGVVFLEHIDRDVFRAFAPTTRLVYFALLPFVGSESQQCWPKANRIAEIVGCSQRTVYRAVHELAEGGYILIGKKEFTPTRRVNIYTLLDPKTPPLQIVPKTK